MDDRLRAVVTTAISDSVATLSAMLTSAPFLDSIGRAAVLCADALHAGHKVLFAGNGGSAADAQHLAAELIGKLRHDRPSLAAVSLTTDTSALTAIANDYGYAEIFRRQIEGIGSRGDVFIAISTSGKSQNLLNALTAAGRKGIATIGLTGASGAAMEPLCDLCLRVPSTDTQRIQEAQIVVGHIVCELIERLMFPAAQ